MHKVVSLTDIGEVREAVTELLGDLNRLPDRTNVESVGEILAIVEGVRKRLPEAPTGHTDDVSNIARLIEHEDGGIDPGKLSTIPHKHLKLAVVRALAATTPLPRLLEALVTEESVVLEGILTAMRLLNDRIAKFNPEVMMERASALLHSGSETDRSVRHAARDLIVSLAEPGQELGYLGEDIRSTFGNQPYLTREQLGLAVHNSEKLVEWYRTLGPNYMHVGDGLTFHSYPLIMLEAERLPTCEHVGGLRWNLPSALWDASDAPALNRNGTALVLRLKERTVRSDEIDSLLTTRFDSEYSPVKLSKTQTECLRILINGSGEASEVVAAQGTALSTVKTHLLRINQTFGTPSTKAAMCSAIWEGILDRDPKTPVPSGLQGELSRRELEVLPFYVAGIGGKASARELIIDEDTYKSHVSAIRRATSLNIPQLIRLGIWGRQFTTIPERRNGALSRQDLGYLQGVVWAMPELEIESHFKISRHELERSHKKLCQFFSVSTKSGIALSAIRAQHVIWNEG